MIVPCSVYASKKAFICLFMSAAGLPMPFSHSTMINLYGIALFYHWLHYANILFLCNNEFGINVILPMRMAPRGLARQLEKKRLTTDVTGDGVHMEYFLIGFTGTMIVLLALEREEPVRRSR